MKHANVALFVPHNGCPYACSFCNQRTITGQARQPSPDEVRQTVQAAAEHLGERAHEAEIAFFGGSFTAIERTYMCSLLRAAAPFVQSGTFGGIRLSTRPDAIDEEVLALLKPYGVTAIELGAQSMSDAVLTANHRGHTAEEVRQASRLIKAYGFSLGLQMMTGLYQSTDVLDRQTAQALADLQPDTMRIYPTVILKGTELATLYEQGVYQPPTLTETVALCADLLLLFEQQRIRVIRLGLHDSDSLRAEQIAGVFHPAFRELCESEILYRHTMEALQDNGLTGGTVTFCIHPSSVSRFVGQKRQNLRRLSTHGITARLQYDASLSIYEVRCITGVTASSDQRVPDEQDEMSGS